MRGVITTLYGGIVIRGAIHCGVGEQRDVVMVVLVMQEPANLDLAKVTTKLELLTGNGKREATHAIVCIALIHSHAFVAAVAKSMLMIRNLV